MIRAVDRGQTLHDFAIGMTIFLLVLGYVFAFIPSLFAPFAPATDSSAVRADRTAAYLTEDVLATRAPGPDGSVQTNAGTLTVECTVDFFDDDRTVTSSTCPIAESSLSIRDLLGLPELTEFNVTMRRNGEIAIHGETGTRLAVGSAPNVAADRVLRAVRIVSFEGHDYRFVVRLW